jgi:hypothetical protein
MQPVDLQKHLSDRELSGLRFIAKSEVREDYWEDATIRLYRELGLVAIIDGRIVLTDEGKRAVGEDVDAPPSADAPAAAR